MVLRQRFSDSAQDGVAGTPAIARAKEEPNNRGVALVITLLLLLLLSVVGLAAVLSTSSDMVINGYYNNYRGSFYAADSGLNIARQQMLTQIRNQIVVPSTPTAPAMPALVITAPASQQLNAGLVAQKSWAGAYTISTPPPPILTMVTCTPAGGTYTPVLPPGCPVDLQATSWKYVYNYTLTSVGRSQGSEQSTVTESGSILLNLTSGPPGGTVSFAYFGAFVDNYPPCLGPLVPGTMTGPMFTNGAWGFMPGGAYIFTDPVGQQYPTASYWDSYWNCWQSPNSSFTAPDGETIAPQFQDGFAVKQPKVTSPQNDVSQQWAALDGTGCGEDSTSCSGTTSPPAPTNAQMNALLKNINQNAYPTTGASSGVYLDYQNINGTPTMAGGGLYVEGNAQMVLNATNGPPPGNDPLQVVTITQGSTVTTMTIDLAANTTTVKSGTTSLVLAGVPADCTTMGAPPNPHPAPTTPPTNPTYCTTVPGVTTGSTPGTMVYVNGAITSMSGTGEGVPAIQDREAITIAALGDINLTGDVVYKSEPVTVAQNQIPNTPVDTLIPGNDHNQDLGIFTANGNIIMSSPYPDHNLQVDGSQAVIGANCAWWSCGFLVNGCINVFNNVGGQIQTNIFGACLNIENTYFDRRYTARTGFAPPFFPSTTFSGTGSTVIGAPNITLQHINWKSSSGQ